MTPRRILSLGCFFVLWAVSPIAAQEIKIRVVQSGSDNLVADLKDIVALTPNKTLQKEWKNLSGTLDEFLKGIDPAKPMVMTLGILKGADGKAGVSYDPAFPISKLEGKKGDSFLENVDGLGYKIKKGKEANLYELTESGKKNAKPMYMRYAHGYAIISESMKSLPANIADPGKAVQPLLAPGYDVAGEIKNDAAGQAKRTEEFQSLRKELEAAIKFKRDEDKSEFELRKLGTSQFFDEIERFLVESESIVMGWTTQKGAKSGKGELQLSALKNTSLEQSITLLSDKPSYFANVKLHDKPILSGKWMFPLDKMRQAQAKVRHPLFRAATKVSIDKRPKLTAEGKAAAKEALDKLVDIFDDSLNIGLEGFIDMHDDGAGKHTAVVAMRAEKAKEHAKLSEDVKAIVELLPKIRNDWQVKLDAVAHGGVSLHEVTFPKDYQDHFQSLFGNIEMILYVGASEEAVWAACGPNGLAELKAAIDDQAKPAPAKADPVFASLAIKFGPWIKLVDVIEKKEPELVNPTKQQIQAKKEKDRIRSLALEAFEAGDDLLTAKLVREKSEIKGEMTITEGVFRFIGSAIANFSKENLR